MTSDDGLSLALARLNDIRAHVQLLASDADTQNAWLHPCGWSRDQPFEHESSHPPCMPIGELCDTFDDMWPAWRTVLEPVLTSEMEASLNAMQSRLHDYFAVPYIDEIETLDSVKWDEVRQYARRAIESIHAPSA